ncbi:MAG: NYN domain-containing protein, partial [Acidimicrobiales bacterium]
MRDRYIVVDGSNIATEGREMPSLAQLDEAVRAFMQERAAGEEIIVVVDATFGHRIDQSERAEYEQAERAGEIVSPPAGAVGRGDAFLLQVADRTRAVVLSNDSFQEFHAEYPWLFDEGRLIGGKPVPKVGWFFTPRTPVRGPKSREAMRAAKKARKASLKRAAVAEGPVADAIAEATAEAIAPDLGAEDGDDGAVEAKEGKRARRRRAKPVGAVNDPLPFIQFIADHPLGGEVEGEVDSFTSHGAFVMAGDARCYVPLSALGDPAPRSAKAVLTRGEVRMFVVQALDPPRRGIELAMPGVARVAGTPTEETVEADIGAGRKAGAGRRKKAAAAVVAATVLPVEGVGAAPAPAPARRARKARKARKEALPGVEA